MASQLRKSPLGDLLKKSQMNFITSRSMGFSVL
jgi:hypothetical protein